MISADKWSYNTGQMDVLTFGAGYLNILGALSSTVVASGRPCLRRCMPTLRATCAWTARDRVGRARDLGHGDQRSAL
jgi:hypothetical protein